MDLNKIGYTKLIWQKLPITGNIDFVDSPTMAFFTCGNQTLRVRRHVFYLKHTICRLITHKQCENGAGRKKLWGAFQMLELYVSSSFVFIWILLFYVLLLSVRLWEMGYTLNLLFWKNCFCMVNWWNIRSTCHAGGSDACLQFLYSIIGRFHRFA